MRLVLFVLVGTLAPMALAGQGYLFPQSACRIHCQNGGACAYDTENPSIHSCICLVGVFEGDRCERLVPGAEDPALATTTTQAPTLPPTTTLSTYEIERRKHEMRIMEQRRKHEEERARLEEERRRIMEERARVEEQRRVEMESRSRQDESRRREEEQRRVEEHRRRMEEDQRRVQEEARRREEESRRAEEERRKEQEDTIRPTDKHIDTVEAPRLDYGDYEDSLDGERMEEVPDDDDDEEIDDVEEQNDALSEEERREEDDMRKAEEKMTTQEPAAATKVTYEVEHDYITSTTGDVADDSKMEGEDDDYWDHTPVNPDIDENGNRRFTSSEVKQERLAGESAEDVVRGTKIEPAERAVGMNSFEAENELEQDSDGWMMVKKPSAPSSSSASYIIFSSVIALISLWLL